MQWMTKFIAFVRVVMLSVVSRIGVAGSIVVVTAAIFSGDVVELWNSIKKDIYDAICGIAREKTGLELMPDDPLSDGSIAAALSARSGIEITTVKDPQVLMRDLSKHAAGIVKEHTGVPLTNLLSAGQVKVDIVAYAGDVVYEQSGLDIRGAVNYDEVQKKIASEVKNKLASLVVSRLRSAAEDFSNPEATLDELLSMISRAQEAKGLNVRDVALGTAASLVVASYAKMSAPMKRRVDAFRRRAQNREAQRRFRERHGNRMRYNPLKPKPAGGAGGTGGATAGG